MIFILYVLSFAVMAGVLIWIMIYVAKKIDFIVFKRKDLVEEISNLIEREAMGLSPKYNPNVTRGRDGRYKSINKK
tara:strand:+ start:6570 stop:6797 length:228 start_codon:yes stop_codon:yes gene_type:complete